jgi:hypothetical protein
MKVLFYAWCLLRATSLEIAMQVWFVYSQRQHAPWFKTYLGRNIFAVSPLRLLFLAPIFDFLSDEGVTYVLRLIHERRPGQVAMLELGLFTTEFTTTVGKHYLNGTGLDAYIMGEDFRTLRRLYLRNLLPILCANSDMADEEVVMNQLLSYELTPEAA